jgi:TfoX/Sxy family transcriptional regulator of competence genes
MTDQSDLASRVGAALEGEAVREVFGGVGFMVNGNLAAAASKRGLLLRVGAERQDEALAQPGIRPMEMRGRRMEGYVYADPPPASDDAVKAWLGKALDYVQTLPEAGRREAQAGDIIIPFGFLSMLIQAVVFA